VGGVLGGLFALALTICLLFANRRRRHAITSIKGQEKVLSPFTTPHPIPGIVDSPEAQGALDRPVSTTAAIMSKGGSRNAGNRTMHRGGDISDIRPEQPVNDADRYQVGGTLPTAVLAQISDAVREEFTAVLRMQASHFQGSRQGSNSVTNEGSTEPPPDYSSERGGDTFRF
jgi:hypothetical protein